MIRRPPARRHHHFDPPPDRLTLRSPGRSFIRPAHLPAPCGQTLHQRQLNVLAAMECMSCELPMRDAGRLLPSWHRVQRTKLKK
jgi:hypothetical protein